LLDDNDYCYGGGGDSLQIQCRRGLSFFFSVSAVVGGEDFSALCVLINAIATLEIGYY